MDKKRRLIAQIIVVAIVASMVLTTVLWAVQLAV